MKANILSSAKEATLAAKLHLRMPHQRKQENLANNGQSVPSKCHYDQQARLSPTLKFQIANGALF
jgi:hypothetical protein